MLRLTLLTAPLLSLGSHAVASEPDPPTPLPENVLILVIDDIGVNLIRSYAGIAPGFDGSTTPNTIRIDQLAAEGVRFDRAWAQPYCSPARASLITGLYPNQTGIGHYVTAMNQGCNGLEQSFETVADLLPAGYRAGVAGKWHLTNGGTPNSIPPVNPETGGPDHPGQLGFDFVAGTKGNITGNNTYLNWPWISVTPTSEASGTSTEYATSITTRDAIRAIDYFGDDPFLLIASYNSVHKPLHQPPISLAPAGVPYEYFGHPIDVTLPIEEQELAMGKAMIEALDFEIGNLIDAMAPAVLARTTIVLMGDNGTQKDLIEAPFLESHGKATVYRDGVRVPLIISGPRVAAAAEGSSCEALVDLTDMLPTIGGITGSAAPTPAPGEVYMGESLLPYLSDPNRASDRQWIYAERFKRNYQGYGVVNQPGANDLWQRTIRNDRFKLMRVFGTPNGSDFCGSLPNLTEGLQLFLFDLEGAPGGTGDPFEATNLIQNNDPSTLTGDANTAYLLLSGWMDLLEDGQDPTP